MEKWIAEYNLAEIAWFSKCKMPSKVTENRQTPAQRS
jgi:hypothetical protein